MATFFIRKSAVQERLGLAATSLNSIRHNDATFPKPVYPTGSKTPMWVLNEIDQWQEALKAARTGDSK